MTRTFSVAFDYLCPFARNACEQVVEGLRAGADWDVDFVPFSLSQVHVEEGEPAAWDREDPTEASGILALQVGVAVRDLSPERFPDAHLALFAARHDEGEDINDEQVLRAALESAGVDPDPVFEEVASGRPLEALQREHEEASAKHEVWGVPTFITRDRAVFVRLAERPDGNGENAVRIVGQLLNLMDGFPVLNEYKETRKPH